MHPRSPYSPVRVLAMLVVASLLVVVPLAPAGATDVPQSVIVNDNPSGFTPHVLDGKVNALLPVGNRIIAAGSFSQVQASGGGATLTRNNIFSFNASSGAIDTGFNPNINGEVKALALAADGDIFAGGSFSSVGGSTARRLVKLDANNGQRITQFASQPSGQVKDLEIRGQTLYVGGNFSSIKGASRENLAAVDATSGNVSADLNLPLTDSRVAGVNPSLYKLEVSPDGTKMIVMGNFTRIDGQVRWQAGMIDLSTTPATVANWSTERFTPPCAINAFDTYMRDVAFSPDGSYFIVVTTGAYRAGTLCDTASRWPTNATGSGLEPTWVDYTGGDTLYSVAVTGTAIYIGGHNRWVNNPFAGDREGPGAVSREGIAALDPVNGLPFSWDPGRARGVGVFDLLATSNGLWVGSDTDRIGGEIHRKLAFFPTAGGTTVPSTDPYTLPGDLYNIPTDLPPAPAPGPIGSFTRRAFDGTNLGATQTLPTPGNDWSGLRGMFALQGDLYYGTSGGGVFVRSFDGASVGGAQQIDLHGLTNFPVGNITGMVYANGGIYYTLLNDAQMYYRYFTPESQVVGADRWVVSGNGDGLNWNATRGLTLANGTLYLGRTNGNLYRMTFGANGPVAGTESLVSPASAGTNWASGGLFVFSASTTVPDTDPPTTPGQPTGQSTVPGSISVNWPGSTDASPPITYRIYRDGGNNPIGTSSNTSFTDNGLTPGSSHTYRVDAVDAVGNESPRGPASAAITVASGQSAIFADDFSGGLGNWSVTNMTIDNGTGGVAPPSARGQVASQAGYLRHNLGAPVSDVCLSVGANVGNIGSSSIVLFRLRTGSGGAIARVYMNQSGVLYVKSDVDNTKQWSGTAIGSGWHTVELCGTVGSNSTWDLYRDGAPIVQNWSADTGTTGVGRIELGDTSSKTWTMNVDDVVLDQNPG